MSEQKTFDLSEEHLNLLDEIRHGAENRTTNNATIAKIFDGYIVYINQKNTVNNNNEILSLLRQLDEKAALLQRENIDLKRQIAENSTNIHTTSKESQQIIKEIMINDIKQIKEIINKPQNHHISKDDIENIKNHITEKTNMLASKNDESIKSIPKSIELFSSFINELTTNKQTIVEYTQSQNEILTVLSNTNFKAQFEKILQEYTETVFHESTKKIQNETHEIVKEYSSNINAIIEKTNSAVAKVLESTKNEIQKSAQYIAKKSYKLTAIEFATKHLTSVKIITTVSLITASLVIFASSCKNNEQIKTANELEQIKKDIKTADNNNKKYDDEIYKSLEQTQNENTELNNTILTLKTELQNITNTTASVDKITECNLQIKEKEEENATLIVENEKQIDKLKSEHQREIIFNSAKNNDNMQYQKCITALETIEQMRKNPNISLTSSCYDIMKRQNK